MSAAEETLAALLDAEGVQGWEREVAFDREEEACECSMRRAMHIEAKQWGGSLGPAPPRGHVPGKRKPWVKCRACNGTGTRTVGRGWRLDFAWPEERVGVEVEGITSFGRNRDGTMRLGRHQTAKGYEDDCQKYNTAACKGWIVLRVTPKQVRDGRAMQWIREALRMRREVE